MPIFKVRRRVDAYLDSLAKVEAADAEEAALLAENNEDDFEWDELGPVGFDARGFVTLDENGDEIDRSRTGDF